MLLLLVLTGFCGAEEVPYFVAYVQGGNTSIMEDQGGSLILTVHDIVPFFYLGSKEESVLIPIEGLSGLSTPLNAAMHFSGSDVDSEAFVVISDLSLSDENSVFTAHVTPNDFYEGQALKTRIYTHSPVNFSNNENYQESRIYLEVPLIPSMNTQNTNDEWGLCVVNCYLNGGPKPCEASCQRYFPN